MTLTRKLPAVPGNMRWVVEAEADRFTVRLARIPGARFDNKPMPQCFIESHTHYHDRLITEAEWRKLVFAAAEGILVHRAAAKLHSQWADEILL